MKTRKKSSPAILRSLGGFTAKKHRTNNDNFFEDFDDDVSYSAIDFLPEKKRPSIED